MSQHNLKLTKSGQTRWVAGGRDVTFLLNGRLKMICLSAFND